MSRYAVAISLKIPDNAAYTALTTLRRLGVDVALVERSEIVELDAPNADEAESVVRTNESVFNPNKHRLTVLEHVEPRPGEVWIEALSGSKDSRAVGWRLFNGPGQPASRATVESACDILLCNPAIERATIHR
jgi:phosphoribosylformylglycinamidine (FGAM) synthase PurS component